MWMRKCFIPSQTPFIHPSIHYGVPGECWFTVAGEIYNNDLAKFVYEGVNYLYDDLAKKIYEHYNYLYHDLANFFYGRDNYLYDGSVKFVYECDDYLCYDLAKFVYELDTKILKI
jgi:hypothetical protein